MQPDKTNRINEALWNLAGFKKDIIQTCKIDAYHASIIGALLFMVGVYATLAWTFFFNTVFDSVLLSFAAGLLMGIFIVCFDRSLIASLSSGNGSFFSLGFRILLALLLGIFLSQPVVLKLYEPEVQREAYILLDKKVNERKVELEKNFYTELSTLASRKTELDNKLLQHKGQLDATSQDFTKEMDGTGGSGKIGYSEISKQKENIFKINKSNYENVLIQSTPELQSIKARQDSIQKVIAANINTYREENGRFGTLLQSEALQELIKKDKSGTLRYRYYLLGIILTLIELSALIAKLFFKTKSYAEKIGVITDEEIKTAEMDREINQTKLEKYKTLITQQDKQLMDDFFEKAKPINNEKLEELLAHWKQNKQPSRLKNYWQQFKEAFLIHS